MRRQGPLLGCHSCTESCLMKIRSFSVVVCLLLATLFSTTAASASPTSDESIPYDDQTRIVQIFESSVAGHIPDADKAWIMESYPEYAAKIVDPDRSTLTSEPAQDHSGGDFSTLSTSTTKSKHSYFDEYNLYGTRLYRYHQTVTWRYNGTYVNVTEADDYFSAVDPSQTATPDGTPSITSYPEGHKRVLTTGSVQQCIMWVCSNLYPSITVVLYPNGSVGTYITRAL